MKWTVLSPIDLELCWFTIASWSLWETFSQSDKIVYLDTDTETTMLASVLVRGRCLIAENVSSYTTQLLSTLMAANSRTFLTLRRTEWIKPELRRKTVSWKRLSRRKTLNAFTYIWDYTTSSVTAWIVFCAALTKFWSISPSRPKQVYAFHWWYQHQIAHHRIRRLRSSIENWAWWSLQRAVTNRSSGAVCSLIIIAL